MGSRRRNRYLPFVLGLWIALHFILGLKLLNLPRMICSCLNGSHLTVTGGKNILKLFNFWLIQRCHSCVRIPLFAKIVRVIFDCPFFLAVNWFAKF